VPRYTAFCDLQQVEKSSFQTVSCSFTTVCAKTCTVKSVSLCVGAKNPSRKPSHDISHLLRFTRHRCSPLNPGMQNLFPLSRTPLLSLSSSSLWKWEWRSISEGERIPTSGSERCNTKSQLPKWNSSMWWVGKERLVCNQGREKHNPRLFFPSAQRAETVREKFRWLFSDFATLVMFLYLFSRLQHFLSNIPFLSLSESNTRYSNISLDLWLLLIEERGTLLPYLQLRKCMCSCFDLFYSKVGPLLSGW